MTVALSTVAAAVAPRNAATPPTPRGQIGQGLVAHRAELIAKLNGLVATAERSGRSHLDAEGDREFRGLVEQITELDDRMTELAGLEARKAAADAARAKFPAPDMPVVRVGAEPGTYRPDSGESFFADLTRSARGDLGAAERLARHAAETAEARGLTQVATDGLELSPPAYLLDKFAPVARARRPFADAVTREPLPESGSSLRIPKASTGTAVASQTSESTAVQNTTMVLEEIEVPVNTIAGQQVASVQLLDRSPAGVDSLIFSDLLAAYSAELDRQLLDGSGTAGQHVGVTNMPAGDGIDTVAYTATSPTAVGLWPKLAEAINGGAVARHAAPSAIVMHPRRWTWLMSALDQQDRPLVVPTGAGPANAAATLTGFDEAIVGTLAGLPVIVDANIPTTDGASTNEDKIVVVKLDDLILWESPMQVRVALDDLAGELSARLVAWSYSAWSPKRYPEAISVISGTGLVNPW